MRINGFGSNWLHRATRLAIYDRDGWRCACCQTEGTETNWLTIDHVVSAGSNDPSNLVTLCNTCNAAKGDKTKRQWFAFLRAKGVSTDPIARRIRRLTSKPIDRAKGRALVLKERARCQSQ